MTTSLSPALDTLPFSRYYSWAEQAPWIPGPSGVHGTLGELILPKNFSGFWLHFINIFDQTMTQDPLYLHFDSWENLNSLCPKLVPSSWRCRSSVRRKTESDAYWTTQCIQHNAQLFGDPHIMRSFSRLRKKHASEVVHPQKQLVQPTLFLDFLTQMPTSSTSIPFHFPAQLLGHDVLWDLFLTEELLAGEFIPHLRLKDF